MVKKDLPYIKHILDSIEKIQRVMKGVSYEQFNDNEDLRELVIRRIEVIGEATKNISDYLKNIYLNVEWKKIAGTRDVLIHAYFNVDNDTIWEIVRDNLPTLKKQILVIKRDLEK